MAVNPPSTDDWNCQGGVVWMRKEGGKCDCCALDHCVAHHSRSVGSCATGTSGQYVVVLHSTVPLCLCVVALLLVGNYRVCVGCFTCTTAPLHHTRPPPTAPLLGQPTLDPRHFPLFG